MIETVTKTTTKIIDEIYGKFKNWPIIFRLPIALILIVVGIIGIITPIMPGWIFFIPGVMLLSAKDGKWLKEKAREWTTRSKRM
ncbi:MAG: hypothetical protein OHK0017_08300 [Patescibacteria group bacterium]